MLNKNDQNDKNLQQHIEQQRRENAADDLARNDPAIRRELPWIVVNLKHLIDEATLYAATSKNASESDLDEIAEILMWQLTDYLVGTQVGRGSADYKLMLKPHDLDYLKACADFDVEPAKLD